MKSKWAGAILALLVAATPAWGTNDPRIADLALCRDSWLDWKTTDPAKMKSFGSYLRSNFVEGGDDGSLAPKSAMSIAGLNVARVFPGSLGMGLGFSAVVDAPFETTKTALAGELRTPLDHCEAGEGMRSCEHSIAEQRTIILASNDPPNDKTTLLGCYYFYEK